jgi:hypothetical protein
VREGLTMSIAHVKVLWIGCDREGRRFQSKIIIVNGRQKILSLALSIAVVSALL